MLPARRAPSRCSSIPERVRLSLGRSLIYKCGRRQIAGAIKHAGVGSGDRVAVDLPQGFDALAVHVAIFRLGAISVPLSPTFAGDGLRHRLEHSGAKIAFGVSDSAARIAGVDRPASLEQIVDVDNSSSGDVNLSVLLDASGGGAQFRGVSA